MLNLFKVKNKVLERFQVIHFDPSTGNFENIRNINVFVLCLTYLLASWIPRIDQLSTFDRSLTEVQ